MKKSLFLTEEENHNNSIIEKEEEYMGYIKNHISNISLGVAVLLVLRYLLVAFGFEIMTLGVAVCLLIVSLTTSLPRKEEKKQNNKYY